MKKILITGSSGFIGRHLSETLAKNKKILFTVLIKKNLIFTIIMKI